MYYIELNIKFHLGWCFCFKPREPNVYDRHTAATYLSCSNSDTLPKITSKTHRHWCQNIYNRKNEVYQCPLFTWCGMDTNIHHYYLNNKRSAVCSCKIQPIDIARASWLTYQTKYVLPYFSPAATATCYGSHLTAIQYWCRKAFQATLRRLSVPCMGKWYVIFLLLISKRQQNSPHVIRHID